ncbi:hypothetical protein E2C01_079425 [Portunus trituberculatus]|uniref:Uncharacterized protein n=1 Tax=Portunus trituberculatus TaxID=210409 RepID=A0A5B7IJI9_PORTR|nr:hypothetical protein [Portunus trituberculatus]
MQSCVRDKEPLGDRKAVFGGLVVRPDGISKRGTTGGQIPPLIMSLLRVIMIDHFTLLLYILAY